MRRVVIFGFALTIAAGVVPVHAQGPSPLTHVRDLYSNAAYEDVLSAVAADANASPQVGQYKVFSLIALGRPADAEQAAEGVLAGHLDFHPDSDASPRLVEVFATARRKVAPDRLKTMYVNARGLLDKKDRDGAIKAFTEVVAVAGDPDLKEDKTAADMVLLANGFLELSRALPAPKPAPDPIAAKSEIPAGSGDPASASAARRPALPVVSPPQPIREDLPRWSPPATLARAEYKGRILVHVGVDGKVASAEILDSVHPLYDELLLTASKGWSYKPGMSNGSPVPADHIVEVVLKPRMP
jgi:hypothetical protein